MKRSRLPEINTVNIATLKAHLAKYLRLARSGQDVVITDHKLPIARLVPIESLSALETIKPERPFSECARTEVPALEPSAKVDSLSFLLKERGER